MITLSDGTFRSEGAELLQIEPWGENILRVRATLAKDFQSFDWALAGRQKFRGTAEAAGSGHVVRSGHLEVRIDETLRLTFVDSRDQRILLDEVTSPRAYPLKGRVLRTTSPDNISAAAQFQAHDDEQFFGLGQHHNNYLNLKGCTIRLLQKNSEICIPFVVSSRGYGFFWNNPGDGDVDLARNVTRWSTGETDQLDYFVIAGPTPAQILRGWFTLTGRPTPLPDWATGFWQSKLRYKTQDELLTVAREYRHRGLPLSMIVIDFFHWNRQGDWDFEPEFWPDPAAMTAELEAMGVKCMVSVWPSANPNSVNWPELSKEGFLIKTERGVPVIKPFKDTHEPGIVYVNYYDATNPRAGEFVWSVVKRNYFDKGIKNFWLDACEPETNHYDVDSFRFHEGNGSKVANLYPLLNEKNFYEGSLKAGQTEVLNLCRSAWAGSQRYGAAVWSGDIFSTFQALEEQVKVGLNMALSGIPWWTTDIGGFYGGVIEDPTFRELIVRWFQYAVFCPLFRLHGFRNTSEILAMLAGGADNEVWSFGEEVYAILKDQLFLREALRPYLQAEAKKTVADGIPLMRPLFFDFPGDEKTWTIEDQYLFGSDILVAPVTAEGQRSRTVYLPAGARWFDANSSTEHWGGSTVTAATPLDRIGVFVKNRPRFW